MNNFDRAKLYRRVYNYYQKHPNCQFGICFLITAWGETSIKALTTDYPELKAIKPNTPEYEHGYWWPQGENEPRMKALLEMINLARKSKWS